MDPELVKQQALQEIKEEEFRKAVEEEKIKIRTHVPWSFKLFPWKITIKIERRAQ